MHGIAIHSINVGVRELEVQLVKFSMHTKSDEVPLEPGKTLILSM